MYLDLYYIINNIVHWLLVDFLGTILNWLTLDGIAGWLATADVLNFVTILVVGVVVLAVGMLLALTFIWIELKVLGRLMDSRGIQIGPLGYFANIATGIKTLLKEIIIPETADEAVYNAAPVIIIGTSIFMFAIIPMSQGYWMTDSSLGLLLAFAIFSIAPFAVLLAGWASNNKYTLIGGMRACAQIISYEIPLIMAAVSVIILTGSLNFMDIVAYQQEHTWLAIPLFIGFFVFIIAMIAELERVPFDLPEAEAELVEGWGTEYGGLRFGLMMFSEYIRGFAGCAIAVLLFLGGWAGPFPDIIPEEIWFLAKVVIVFTFFVWIRGTLPRVRTDQILGIGWKRLLPLAAVNILIAIAFKSLGWF